MKTFNIEIHRVYKCCYEYEATDVQEIEDMINWDVNDNVESSLANDRCGKRVSSCKLRFGANNALPFGSFPSAGRQH